MKPEIVFNIWFIVDIGTRLSRYCLIRCYKLDGADDEKLNILKKLSEYDYITADRINYCSGNALTFTNGTVKGYVPLEIIQKYFEMQFDFFVRLAEIQLPQKIEFSGEFNNNHKLVDQKMGPNPLYVSTILMENEYGEIKPYTTQANKRWFETEEARINQKVKKYYN